MTKRDLRYSSFLASRYWSMWSALALAKFAAFLPLRIQHAIGKALGVVAYSLLKRRREVTLVNIQTCFPELSSEESEQLARRCFISNGIGIMEAFRSWFRSPDTLRSIVRFEGEEHLKDALAQGRGVILLGGHFSTLDLAGSLTTLFFEADVMQRDHRNGLFNAVMTRSRDRLYGKVISKHDVRGLLERLRANKVVWYATDQDYGRNKTVFAPFFGTPCSCLTSTAKLAAKTGAAVVPFSHYRLPDGQGYVLKVSAALQDFPSGEAVADATRLNAILEKAIRAHPEQYLWMHRRFKTPPERGELNIYGQLRDA